MSIEIWLEIDDTLQVCSVSDSHLAPVSVITDAYKAALKAMDIEQMGRLKFIQKAYADLIVLSGQYKVIRPV